MKNKLLAILLVVILTVLSFVTVGAADKVYVPREPVGEKNLLVNGGFEEVDENGIPTNWEAFSGWEAEFATLHTNDAHTGNNSVKIETYNGGNPWVRQIIPNIMGGATYQISFWYKGEVRGSSGFSVKFEGYNGHNMRTDNGVLQQDIAPALKTATEWTRVVFDVKVPDNCTLLTIYPRCYSNSGTMYVDDLELYMVEIPALFTLDTDQVFYYSDLNTGMATVNLNQFSEDEGYTVDFKISDGTKTLTEQSDVAFKDKASKFIFPVRIMAEKKKEYTLTATAKNADGSVNMVLNQPIYKYDRPKMLTKDGNFIVDGKPFYPGIIYHPGDVSTYDEAASVGLNVVQVTGRETVEATLQMLDSLQTQGIKAAFVLYHGMHAAGDPINVEQNKELVPAIKDHPAIFCWMTMDEPLGHYKDIEELHNILRTGYKLIRDVDDVHPIYHCESSPDHYGMALKYVDAIGLDPYPAGNGYEYLVADRTASAEEVAEKFGKGIMQVLQVFTFMNSKPTPDQVHSMMYQSILGGAEGNGVYPWVMDNPIVDPNPLNEGEFWPVFESFRAKEYDKVWAHYGKHFNTHTFNSIRTDDAWVDVWVDGLNIYAVVINRQAKEQTISIPLISDNGLEKIALYSVTPINNEKEINIEKTNDEILVTIDAGCAQLFQINAEKPVSTGMLNKFNDISDYGWAEKSIDFLNGIGVVNSKGNFKFAPSENITRGDFAMFLVKALGLDTKLTFTDNFSDVSADAEYAAAVAAGKKAGILMGTGDNKFNPEAPITRQDLMTICSRAMKYVRLVADADMTLLDSFSDKDLIAEYAASSIAAMVRDGIVLGNSDGTINPLGNTTRAEAAVIMERLYNWNKG